jgi:hypothetical protein
VFPLRGPGIARASVWAALIVFGGFRVGVDSAERWLVRPCWSVPSCWNAVAEVAVRSGVVDPGLEGRPAPWRQASIFNEPPPPLAIVTVSDMRRSRVTFLDEGYGVRGLLERATADPLLVTDEQRGFRPLSHLWPVFDSNRDGRLETLIAFAPTLSEELRYGTYAYVALGPETNEVLLACRLRSAPGPRFAWLGRADVNDDGYEDLIVRSTSEAGLPHATFLWNADKHAYLPNLHAEAQVFVSSWCASDGDRLIFPREESLDERMRAVLERLE